MPTAPVVHESVDPGDVLDYTRLSPGLELVIGRAGVSLVAQLGHKLRMQPGLLQQKLALVEGAAKGLFAVNVQPFLEGSHSYREMSEVRYAHKDSVQLARHFVE